VDHAGRRELRVAAFLGPSLPRGVALRLLPDLILLPPARRGDLAAALDAHHLASVLIADGLLPAAERVARSEVQGALECGVRVVGAAGLGGLLAAELASLGMEGVGLVFDGYRRGVLTDESEVALAYGDAADGFRAVTWPMVNVRATLSTLAERGELSSAESGAVLAAAYSVGPESRTGDAVGERLGAAGWPQARVREVLRLLVDWYVDQLAFDAGEALAYLAGVEP
jgi:hypothetical protein